MTPTTTSNTIFHNLPAASKVTTSASAMLPRENVVMDVEDEVDYESIPNASLSTNMLAGALAGIAEHSVMYPFDSIKTRMQVLTPAAPQAIYSSVSQALQRITSTEGARALWKGIGSVFIGAGPAHALHFGTYEAVKESLSDRISSERNGLLDARHLVHATAGACATIAHDGLMTPFDVVKQRMQLYGSTYKSPMDALKSIVKTEGMGALYVSYPTTLMMSMPFQSIQFTTYEMLRHALNSEGGYQPSTHVVAGGLAGGFASILTNPLDVTKTLLQTRGTSSDAEIRNANGLRDGVRIIYQRYGLAGFFRGIKPRFMTQVPSTAISWSTYEFFKWMLLKKD